MIYTSKNHNSPRGSQLCAEAEHEGGGTGFARNDGKFLVTICRATILAHP